MLNILSPTQTRRTQPCDYTANNNVPPTLLQIQTQHKDKYKHKDINEDIKTKMNTKENVEYILNTQTWRTQPCVYTANNNLHQTLLQR